MMKREQSRSPRNMEKTCQKSLDIAPIYVEYEDEQSVESATNQLVVYNPDASNTGHDVLEVSDLTEDYSLSYPSFSALNPSSRILPSVGAYAVQCCNCFKWRLVPDKEIYEAIRGSILENPFVCDRAREWCRYVSCDDPADICQDDNTLWALDKPNIPQPPPGWERQTRLRGEGSSKFADIYYKAPSGKTLRSKVEIGKYLLDHPEYIRDGVNLSQFSFQIPKASQENYVRKRPARVTNHYDGAGSVLQRPLEPFEVNPLSWARPPTHEELQLGCPGLSPYTEQRGPELPQYKDQSGLGSSPYGPGLPFHTEHNGPELPLNTGQHGREELSTYAEQEADHGPMESSLAKRKAAAPPGGGAEIYGSSKRYQLKIKVEDTQQASASFYDL